MSACGTVNKINNSLSGVKGRARKFFFPSKRVPRDYAHYPVGERALDVLGILVNWTLKTQWGHTLMTIDDKVCIFIKVTCDKAFLFNDSVQSKVKVKNGLHVGLDLRPT